MNIKFLALTLATMTLMPLASMAETATATVTVTGNKAIAVTRALLASGFQGKVGGDVRTLKIDSLVFVEGIGNHECDDYKNIECGFTLPAEIQRAEQTGKELTIGEVIQLDEILTSVIDPILHRKGINNSDSGMGHTYTDYGKISCSWKVRDQSGHPITNASCTMVVPNYSN